MRTWRPSVLTAVLDGTLERRKRSNGPPVAFQQKAPPRRCPSECAHHCELLLGRIEVELDCVGENLTTTNGWCHLPFRPTLGRLLSSHRHREAKTFKNRRFRMVKRLLAALGLAAVLVLGAIQLAAPVQADPPISNCAG